MWQFWAVGILLIAGAVLTAAGFCLLIISSRADNRTLGGEPWMQ